ncbi:hypothetical protein GCM10023205_46100 [Yinghuangia aomiensis]|uniref:Uncharacterized protein n=1 Tax=Yinghuangia aomiensis TaxID=676205 RepID=A0ABP9HMM1_9ACTN
MRMPWRRRPTGLPERLLEAAGIPRRSLADTSDREVCREVAFRTVRRDNGALAGVLAVLEEELAGESEYELAVSFLEDLRNLSSHDLAVMRSSEEVRLLLGPRSTVCWNTVGGFWTEVARWCARTDRALEPMARFLDVDNPQLQALVWTGSRTLPGGERLGLAEALLFEKNGGTPIPGSAASRKCCVEPGKADRGGRSPAAEPAPLWPRSWTKPVRPTTSDRRARPAAVVQEALKDAA